MKKSPGFTALETHTTAMKLFQNSLLLGLFLAVQRAFHCGDHLEIMAC